jgi:hypothetical protein
MELILDDYEKDLILETLEYRLENDKDLVLSNYRKEELLEMIRKIEE